MTTPDDGARRLQLEAAALAYFEGLRRKDFDLIPFADEVQLTRTHRARRCRRAAHRS